MTRDARSAAETTRAYYNSKSADEFYFRIWGGESIHVGIYESEDDSIREAGRRTVARMAELLPDPGDAARVLDLGSGYGGPARFLARERGYHVDCLNLSAVQNERNRDLNEQAGLDGRIEVFEGAFECLPFDAQTYDVVWSQDAILHSGRRERVLDEVDRVLRPGGNFVFTDIMQREGCPAETLEPVYGRINLTSMGSFEFYCKEAEGLGWEEMAVFDLSPNLAKHFSHVRGAMRRRRDELLQHCGPQYVENMVRGIRHWIAAAEDGNITWGLFHFRQSGCRRR